MLSIEELFAIRLYHGYIPQILLAEAIFTYCLRRREEFAKRLMSALPIYLVLSVVLPNFIAHYASGWFSLTIFALSLLLCRFLFENGWTDILFCCVFAQLTQNLSYNLENLIYLPLVGRISTGGWLAISLGSMIFVYAVSAFVFYRRVREEVSFHLDGRLVFPIAIVSMLFVYVMQYLFQVYGIDQIWVSRPPLIVCCLFGLSLQMGLLAYKDEQEEKEKLEYFLQQANRQFEMSRANVDLLNMKAHDLKHYIRRVKELSGSAKELGEMEDVVREYEKSVRCGNGTLDVLLTDKQYICRTNGIDLTMMIDGSELDFMAPSDLVSLFSNALDNAIECELKEEEKWRSIAVKVFRKGTFLTIHVENYCSTRFEIRDGLPLTTKEDNGLHGFGMKSMRYVAEKYNGSLSCGMRENTFVLNVLLSVS